MGNIAFLSISYKPMHLLDDVEMLKAMELVVVVRGERMARLKRNYDCWLEAIGKHSSAVVITTLRKVVYRYKDTRSLISNECE